MKKFALAGNPNCGKTTLFNNLTGSTAHVGNWPGVTVDKREGVYKKCAEPVSIVDLPGIYSLSPYTPEEVIARNYISDDKPDCVINIVDATNLERNLYLTTQVLEMDVPMVIALNMMDAVEKNGDKIDARELEKRLGVPVVKISALRSQGLSELMDKAYNESKKQRFGITVLEESNIAHLIADVKTALTGENVSNPLFHAVKLVEGDEIEVDMHKEVLGVVEAFKKTFKDDIFGTDFEALIADARYKYISEHFAPVFERKTKEKFKMTKSDKADRVLTHKIWGIPIFILILFAIFHLTFSEDFLFLGSIFGLPSLVDLGMADPITEEPLTYGAKWLSVVYNGGVMSPGVMINNLWNDIMVGELFGWIQGLVEQSNMSDWAVGLINNGIIDGVGSVLSFLPPILVLFLFFSILEDSGYMARIAFILDRMFRRFGLSGRAFMPMIMGFGCSVPAAVNTRTLSDEKERTATIRVIPFFSCGAKLPILTAVAGGIVAAFGVGNSDLITYGMYVLGVASAIVCVLLMRNTSLKGETPPFIMELPAYHWPKFKNLMLHLWDKTKHFVKKAFTIIFASTVIIWLFSHLSFKWGYLPDEEMNSSILASIGMLLQPVFTPLGFGSQLGQFGWVFAVAAITGLVAKENVIATFTTLALCIGAYAGAGTEDGVEELSGLIAAITADTGISQGQFVAGLIAFIAFNMTTIPCFAACATARAELPKGKFKWTLLFWLAASFVISAAVYTVGAWWWTLFIWLAVIAVVTTFIVLRNIGKFDILRLFKIRRKSNKEE